MQRYDPIGRDGEYYPDLMEPRDKGEFVLHAEAKAEIDALRNDLAESIRVREEMQLGGNRLAESLRLSKARVEDLEAEIEGLHAECDRLKALQNSMFGF